MKKIFLPSLLIMVLGMSTVHAQQVATGTTAAAPASAAGISFKETSNTYDFGTVPQGTPVTHNFTLTNTGKAALILSSVTPSCGCTSPEWPKEPIAPGKSAVIKVTYNAQAMGVFNKNITVISNASTPQTVLYIKGEVKAAAPQAAASQPEAAKTANAPKKN